MGKIRILAAVIMALAWLPAMAQEKFTLKIKPPIPESNPAGINPGCNKCDWEIAASTNGETQLKHIKAMRLDNKYRLEIKNGDSTLSQVILFDNAELYILNDGSRTASLYYLSDADNLMFLEGIFPGIGLSRRNRTVLGAEKLFGRDCDVISYRILKRGRNMFVWATAKEWLDRQTGRTMKVETVTDPAQAPVNGKMETYQPVTQVYTAGKANERLFMDKALFKVPKGYAVVDMKKQYDEALEKQKGIKPGPGYEFRKITIPAKKGDK